MIHQKRPTGASVASPRDPSSMESRREPPKAWAKAGAVSTSKPWSSPHPMSPVRTGSSGMEFDIDKALLPHWDARLEDDLFSGVDLDEIRLDEGNALCRSIFAKCAKSIGVHIRIAELIPFMKQREMLNSDDEFQVMNEHLSKPARANNLVVCLPGNGEKLKPVTLFYCSLLESSSARGGLNCHYILAQRLREIAHQTLGIVDIRAHDKMQKDLAKIISKVQSSTATVEQKYALISHLNLKIYDLKGTEALSFILDLWRQKENCDWTELVEALVLTPKLGYLVSDLLSPCLSNPPQMCQFVHKLEGKWTKLADHLGYPLHLIRSIQDQWNGDYHEQVEAFLRTWVFPHCREGRNSMIIEKLRHFLLREEDSRPSVTVPINDFVSRSSDDSSHVDRKKFDPDMLSPGFKDEYCGTQLDIPHEEPHCDLASELKPMRAEETSPYTPDDSKQAHLELKHGEEECEVRLKPSKECTMGSASKPPDAAVRPDEYECCYELLRAIKEDNRQVINHLLEKLSYTECRGEDGKTPFLLFCANGLREEIELIVLAGAAVDVVDSESNCCFHYKEVLRNPELMKILLSIFSERELKYPVNVSNKLDVTPLMVACKLGESCYGSVQMLLAHGAEPNGPKRVNWGLAKSTPLIIASQDNCQNLVKMLLDYGADIDGQDKDLKTTALIQACAWAHTNMVTFLLERGANVSLKEKDGTAALSAAVRKNAIDIVQLLIKYNANVNERSFAGSYGGVEETPLAIACANGFQDVAEILIRSGARTDYQCSGQVPPIGFAIIRRKLAMVHFMLQNTPYREKSVYTLAVAFNIAMTVENYEAAGLILNDYGDREVLQFEAREAGLMQFVDQINMFNNFVQCGLAPRDVTISSSSMQLDDEKAKVEDVLQQFCNICMKAAATNCECETLAAIAEVAGKTTAANFFKKYRPLMSPKELKSGLVSGGKESALNFLIEQNVLTIEGFHAAALQMYSQRGPDEFYQSLAIAVHMIRGSEIMSYEPHDVLQFMLSGQALLVEQSVPMSQAKQTWEEPRFPSSGASFSSHRYSSGATGIGPAPSTGSSGWVPSNTSHFPVDAEKGLTSRRVSGRMPPSQDVSGPITESLKAIVKITKNFDNNAESYTSSVEAKVKAGNRKSDVSDTSLPKPVQQPKARPTASTSSASKPTKPIDSSKTSSKQLFSAAQQSWSHASHQTVGQTPSRQTIGRQRAIIDSKDTQGMHHSLSTPVMSHQSHSDSVLETNRTPSPLPVQQQMHSKSSLAHIPEKQVPVSASTDQLPRKRQDSEPLLSRQPSAEAHPSQTKVERLSTPLSSSKEPDSRSSQVTPPVSSLDPISLSRPHSHSQSEDEDNLSSLDDNLTPQVAVANTPLHTSNSVPNMSPDTSTVTVGLETHATSNMHGGTTAYAQNLPVTTTFVQSTAGSSSPIPGSTATLTTIQSQGILPTQESGSSLPENQATGLSESTSSSLSQSCISTPENSSIPTHGEEMQQVSSVTTSSQTAKSQSMPHHSQAHQFRRQWAEQGHSSDPGPSGAFRREVSRDSSFTESLPRTPSDQKAFRIRPKLRVGKKTSLKYVSNTIERLQSIGFNRGEVTVHLGEEPAGTYWFKVPGTKTITAIEHALDEASLMPGYNKACLNFEIQQFPEAELEDEEQEDTDTQDWERLNPTESTGNLRLVELRLRNAYRNGLRNVTFYYSSVGDPDYQEFEEELTENASSDFLMMFADKSCSELRFHFS